MDKETNTPQKTSGTEICTGQEIIGSGIETFSSNDTEYVLVKDLASQWGYTSSYQLLSALLKDGVLKSQILKTTREINESLISLGLIEDADIDRHFFYIATLVVSSVVSKEQGLVKSFVAKNGYLQVELSNVASKQSAVSGKNGGIRNSFGEEDAGGDSGKDKDSDEDVDGEEDEEDEVDDPSEPLELVEVEKSGKEQEQEQEQERITGRKEYYKTLVSGGGKDANSFSNKASLGKKPKHVHKHAKDFESRMEDVVTVGHVFPQYGAVESSTKLNHAQFGCLNQFSKLNYYKSLTPPGLKFLPNTKLTFYERELVEEAHNYSHIDIDEHDASDDKQRAFLRKSIGKSKKNNIHLDPNTVDLNETVIPGQGYIGEFSINHICKVPNYYVTSNHTTMPQSVSARKLNSSSNSLFLFNEGSRLSKNVQQLVFSNENDNHSHHKYYYTKSYRGPGSGNYKDAALMNKINKIHLTESKKKHFKRNVLRDKKYTQNLKGLVHEKFNKEYVESLLTDQRRYTEDYSNVEILHNNLQYNVLLNSYRDISRDTWGTYYKFKLFDFEQYKALQEEEADKERRDQNVVEQRKWTEDDKLRQERLRMQSEEERDQLVELQKTFSEKSQQMEERKRRAQLDPSVEDKIDEDEFVKSVEALREEFEAKRRDICESFAKRNAALAESTKPPVPVETPQLDVVSRFSLPGEFREIVKHLPLELRSTELLQKEIPSLKKPIQYVTTIPGKPDMEYLTKIEVIKFPNPNSLGWDNLRKYKQ